jgi:UDP-glucose 4-epimerase
MRILVTGGAGFIGSHLVDRLVADGHAVTVLDDLSTGNRANVNAAARLVIGDVADAAQLNALVAEADAVFHLAAVSSVQICEQQPELAARTNITGVENLFAAAATRNIPIIYASSAAVYGDNPNLPLNETATPQPLGNYGRQKLENERIAARYTQVPSVGLRFFNVYGPRQDPRSPYSGVISIFVDKAKAGQPITFYGDGEQTRDFIYVGDIVNLLVAASNHANGQHVLNGCTGSACSLKHLAATIGEALGAPLTTNHAAAREGDIRLSCGNPIAAVDALGFRATTALKVGLKELVSAHA